MRGIQNHDWASSWILQVHTNLPESSNVLTYDMTIQFWKVELTSFYRYKYHDVRLSVDRSIVFTYRTVRKPNSTSAVENMSWPKTP